jgi:hypothetical protein
MRDTTSLPSGEMSDEDKEDLNNANLPKTFGDWASTVAYEVDPEDVDNSNLPRHQGGWGRTVGDTNNHNMPNDFATGEMSDEEKNDVTNGNMPKSMSFKDFMAVDYTPGMSDYISYQAHKRHRGTVGEALSHAQRIKASLRMKKMSKRIGLARKRAMKRTPSMDQFKKRATRQARTDMLKRFTRGVPKSELSMSRKADIEKKLGRMKGRIQRIAMRLLPDVRKKDRDRKRGKAAPTTDNKNND